MGFRVGIIALAAAAIACAPVGGAQTPHADGLAPLVGAIQAFDWKSDHILLALPPGLTVKGPFWLSVNVVGDGQSQLTRLVPFTGDTLKSPASFGLPADAHVLRLSPDKTWPQHIADLGAALATAKEKFAPGNRSMEFFFKIALKIDDSMKPTYCAPGAGIPIPKLLVQKGDNPSLTPVDMGPGTGAVMKAIRGGCGAAQPPPT